MSIIYKRALKMETESNRELAKSIRSKQEIIADLEALVFEPGFIYSLVFMLRHDNFFAPEDAADINWRERLSYQEFSYLAGLMVKKQIHLGFPAEEQVQSQIERTYELLREFHDAYWTPVIASLHKDRNGPDQGSSQLFTPVEFMTEPIFHGSSGAYDFQCLEFAKERCKKDLPWIQANKGFDIYELTQIFWKLKKLAETKLRNLYSEHHEFQEFCEANLNVFCFSKEDLTEFREVTIRKFIGAFSLSPGEANERLSLPGEFNALPF